MKAVEVWASDGKDVVKRGIIRLENGRLIAEPDDERMRKLLSTPITVAGPNGTEIVTAADPEVFLYGLPKFYRGSYFHVVPVKNG